MEIAIYRLYQQNIRLTKVPLSVDDGTFVYISLNGLVFVVDATTVISGIRP